MWDSLFKLTELEEIQVGVGVDVDDKTMAGLAKMPRLRRLDLHIEPPTRKYTPAGIAAFRRDRPDVHLRIPGEEYPALANWPGKSEGSASVAPWNLPKDAPAPAVVPFSLEQAKKHQDAWADYLKSKPLIENKFGMKFALIPPSEMVDNRQEGAVLVRQETPYYLGTTEVTVGQFKKFVEATEYKTVAEVAGNGKNLQFQPAPKVSWRSPGYPIDDQMPVSVVSYMDAVAFCKWLSKEDGFIYRLPTESEWSFACRAGGTKPHGFLDSVPAVLAEYIVAGKLPSPVASKKANPFGLHDILGNLHEFCAGSGGICVRGSAYNHTVEESTVASRYAGDWIQTNTGFRVLRQTTKDAIDVPIPGKLSEKPILVERGQPLSLQATVSRPIVIPSVRSWSVELAADNRLADVIAWSPKGDVISTSGTADRSVRLWNRDGTLNRIFLGHKGDVTSVAFSSDGSLLASCDRCTGGQGQSTVRIWEARTGACKSVIPLPGWGSSVAFAPQSRSVGVCGNFEYAVAFVFDLDTGEWRSIGNQKGWGGPITWSPDGKFLATLFRIWQQFPTVDISLKM